MKSIYLIKGVIYIYTYIIIRYYNNINYNITIIVFCQYYKIFLNILINIIYNINNN